MNYERKKIERVLRRHGDSWLAKNIKEEGEIIFSHQVLGSKKIEIFKDGIIVDADIIRFNEITSFRLVTPADREEITNLEYGLWEFFILKLNNEEVSWVSPANDPFTPALASLLNGYVKDKRSV